VLNQYQQGGVPLVLVYPQSSDVPLVVPVGLTAWSTERHVLDALNQAAQP
jgi:hypothetical protein